MRHRPSRDIVMMDIAKTMSVRSTCLRLQVGCVFSLAGRVLSTGYNGAPSGMAHCKDSTCNEETPCINTGHAEANGIAFAAKYGVSLNGCSLYTTDSPCRSCAILIVNVGVEKVYYSQPYRDTSGLDLIRAAFIPVEHLV